MFKNKTITLNEALGLSGLIRKVKEGFDIIPFKLDYRLNRQLTKLDSADKELGEIKISVLKELIGEDKLSDMIKENTPISDILSEGQMKEFTDLMNKELQNDIEIGLLTESFEDLIGNPSLESKVSNALSALMEFYEENVWKEES